MMKRNESILVYGVTGLLLVILFVAVFFGNEGSRSPQSDELAQRSPDGSERGARSLEELLNLDPPGPLGPPEGAGAAVDGAPADPALAAGPEASPTGAETEDAADAAADPGAAPPEVGAADASSEAGDRAGTAYALTTRAGSFREVTVRPGDTFSTLVQHWCGSLDQLPLAEALNEDVDKHDLPVGRKLILPWVDDAALAAARKERRITEQKREALSGQTYVVRHGDSLWNIAVQATGSDGRAPAYIARVLELNPGLVPEKIRTGQQIVLPPP